MSNDIDLTEAIEAARRDVAQVKDYLIYETNYDDTEEATARLAVFVDSIVAQVRAQIAAQIEALGLAGDLKPSEDRWDAGYVAAVRMASRKARDGA